MRPEPKFVKVNVDATFFENERSGATTVVIRDEKGKFLAAQCTFIPHVVDVVSCEAQAMRDGLVLANSLGFPRVEAELDSTTVVEQCSGQNRWWDVAAVLFAEGVEMASMIGKVKFRHCGRETNQVAHVLANYCYCNKLSRSWTNDPPDCVISKLLNDVIPF